MTKVKDKKIEKLQQEVDYLSSFVDSLHDKKEVELKQREELFNVNTQG